MQNNYGINQINDKNIENLNENLKQNNQLQFATKPELFINNYYPELYKNKLQNKVNKINKFLKDHKEFHDKEQNLILTKKRLEYDLFLIDLETQRLEYNIK